MGLIAIGKEGQCSCNCATRCVVDRRSGSSVRCTKEEIEAAGFSTILVENSIWFDKNTILRVKEKLVKRNWYQRLFNLNKIK